MSFERPSGTGEKLLDENNDGPFGEFDGDIFSPVHIRQEIVEASQNDECFKPFVTLFALDEDPNIDFSSSAIERLFHEIEESNNDWNRNIAKSVRFPSTPFLEKAEVVDSTNLLSDEGDAEAESLQHAAAPIVSRLPFLDDITIEHVPVEQFCNWGETVKYNAPDTFVVRSINGIGSVIRWAKEQGKKVRAAGFRHSWSDIFGGSGDVIVMFLPYDVLVTLPHRPPSQTFINSSELLGISTVPEVLGKPAPAGKAFCKVMAGTTNEMFRQWCFDHKKWCLPLNVVMVEVTFGGSNAPICHGAGLTTQTLSDLVRALEYVDANGNKQTVDDPHELRAAAGCFGLLGIVVSLTLEVENMYVVDMTPAKVPLALAVPPPKNYPIPTQVQEMMRSQGITETELDQARDNFISQADKNYYLEWFWFPHLENAWVNTWTRRIATPGDADAKAYPDSNWLTGVKAQEDQGRLAEFFVNSFVFRALPGRMQAHILSTLALLMLPDVKSAEDVIKTYQSEALHFRRGIQNFRVRDCEWEISIPRGSNGKLDLEVAQRAWWDGISAIYSREDAPVRVALEMRLTGGSDVLLAPQRGNIATASIEVLTTLVTPQGDWEDFMQQIAHKWTSYDVGGGAGATHPRPHWAKQWAGLEVHGKPIERYIREDAYREAFEEFRTTYADILAKRGLTVEDTLRVFGNAMMERLIWGGEAAQ